MGRILLVEPDHIVAKTYRKALERAGHIVNWQRTAQGGIHTLDAEPADLVILELAISGHNGVEFLYELRSYSEWQNLPVMLLTSVEPTIMQNEVLTKNIKISHYLHKPTTRLSELVEVVNRTVQVA